MQDTFHELNKIMDKVDYQGNRYVFESQILNGTLLQGNLQAGLEFRLSEVQILEKVHFIRRKTETLRWYMDITVRPGAGVEDAVVNVNFHNRKEEQDAEIEPCELNSCNFQISPSVLQPYYLGKYDRLQEVMESSESVLLTLPAIPGTADVIHRCLDHKIESVLHSRVLHNRMEGLFLSHLVLCWDQLLESK